MSNRRNLVLPVDFLRLLKKRRFMLSAIIILLMLTSSSRVSAVTWKQIKKWSNSAPKNNGSSYSRPRYQGTSPGPTKSERAKLAAQQYCVLRNSGLDHNQAWEVAYKKVKTGSGLFGAFKMSPKEARDLISDKIIEGKQEPCNQYLRDFYPRRVVTSSGPRESSQSKSNNNENTNQMPRLTGPQIAEISRQVTVMISGPTEGSGVILSSGQRKTKLITSWHVVDSIASGEELYATTYDGRMHRLTNSSIARIKNIDLATVEFISQDTYQAASLVDSSSIEIGKKVYVSGFPRSTTTIPSRLYRFLTGEVISYSPSPMDLGYQVMYNNPTLSGMSGGGVFNSAGELLAIHGRAETDARLTEQMDVAVKTNTNLGIPLYPHKESVLMDDR